MCDISSVEENGVFVRLMFVPPDLVAGVSDALTLRRVALAEFSECFSQQVMWFIIDTETTKELSHYRKTPSPIHAYICDSDQEAAHPVHRRRRCLVCKPHIASCVFCASVCL